MEGMNYSSLSAIPERICQAKPVHDEELWSYMDGAIRSGEDVAMELIQE